MNDPNSSAIATTAESDSRNTRVINMSEIHAFSEAELNQLKLVHSGSGNDNLIKVFRDLRTRVYTRAKGKNFTCMVASIVAGGGGSYIAKNLASTIALDKTKTSLLVDANFYAPSTKELVVTDTDIGLTDYLDNEDIGVESVVYATGIARVRVVPIGGNSESATEKLSSKRMKLFMDELKNRYKDRYVIVDSPSVEDYSADVRILSSLCDFILLVVPYAKVTESQVNNAIKVLGKDKIAGLVFNYL